MSSILNVAFVGLLTLATAGVPPYAGTASLVTLLVNTKFADHAKVKNTSQLINDISSVLQKLTQQLMRQQIQYFFLLLFTLVLVL